MNWWQRIHRKREIARDVQHDLGAAVELNALNLADVAAIKAMLETDGGQMYINELRKDLIGQQKQVEQLAVDPETNKHKLTFHAASCAILRRQIAFLDGILSKEPDLLRESVRLTLTE